MTSGEKPQPRRTTMPDRRRPLDPSGRYRMRRFTDDEMEHICDLARSHAKAKGPVEALGELWDLILRDAEGVTADEATERGLTFHVGDYQIAADQANAIRHAMNHRRYRSERRGVSFLWFNNSPGQYDIEDGDHSEQCPPCGRPPCRLPWAAHDWSTLARFDRDPLSANDPAPRDEIDFVVEAAFDAGTLDDLATGRFDEQGDDD